MVRKKYSMLDLKSAMATSGALLSATSSGIWVVEALKNPTLENIIGILAGAATGLVSNAYRIRYRDQRAEQAIQELREEWELCRKVGEEVEKYERETGKSCNLPLA